MNRLRRTFGIFGVVLMLLGSMGTAVYAQEEGAAPPTETTGEVDTDQASTDGGAGDASLDETTVVETAATEAPAAETSPDDDAPSNGDSGGEQPIGDPPAESGGGDDVETYQPEAEVPPALENEDEPSAGVDQGKTVDGQSQPAESGQGDGDAATIEPPVTSSQSQVPAETPQDAARISAAQVGSVTFVKYGCDGFVTVDVVINDPTWVPNVYIGYVSDGSAIPPEDFYSVPNATGRYTHDFWPDGAPESASPEVRFFMTNGEAFSYEPPLDCSSSATDPGTDDPVETGKMTLTLRVCGDTTCSERYLSADGATAIWTVEPISSAADSRTTSGFMAARTPLYTYSAIVEDGQASVTTDALPLGAYQVCLSNVLTGGPSGDVSIADAPICDTVELTEAGATTPAPAAFTATIQDGDPADPGNGDPADPGDGVELKVVSLTWTSPDVCSFLGGTATVTGTSQVEGYDASMRADLAVGWETPAGRAIWGTAHQGPGGTWADRVLEVNGPWSISKTAYDPVIGGKDVGIPRPADATAVFVTLELRRTLTAEPDATLSIRFPLANCGSDPGPDPVETGQIELSLSLVDASGNADTSADGATATWTVEPVDAVASNPNINGLRAARASAATYTAVLAGGVASTTTEPLPLGTYRVCLGNVLAGGPNGDLSIGDGPICDTVELTAAGTTTPVAAAFAATIQDNDSGDGEPSQPGGGSGDAGSGAAEASDTSAGVVPSGQSPAGSDTGATVVSGTSGAAASSTSATSGQAATTLPNTGAGPAGGHTTVLTWLLVASSVFAATGFAIRRRTTA